jgi:hypothetical protein
MGGLGIALRRLVGLFVDDGSLALATVAWLGLIALAAVLWPMARGWLSLLLALGLLAILAENVLRAAAAKR